MKIAAHGVTGMLVALSLVGGTVPALAAGPYTIHSSGAASLSASGLVLKTASCNPAVVNSPANGLDGYMLDVSSMAGKARTLTWKSPLDANPLAMVGVSFFGKGCDYLSAVVGIQEHTVGVTVPAGAKYALVEAFYTVQVTFTL